MHFDALREVRARAAHPKHSTQGWTEIDELSSPSKWSLLSNAVQEQELTQAISLLRAANTEPILIKGWGVARLYPAGMARPLGDVDLFFSHLDAFAATAVLEQNSPTLRSVDLHRDGDAALPPFAEVLEHSEMHALGDCLVRVPGHEHQLRLVALHMLRHGAWRPLWLVDVAVLLEARPENFDWNLCLGPQKSRASWVLTALVLAHKLLGARIEGTPAERHPIPDWLVPEVLKRWEHPDPAEHQPPASILTALAHPWRLPAALRNRWPDPISAAIATGRGFPEKRTPLLWEIQYLAQLTKRFLGRKNNTHTSS